MLSMSELVAKYGMQLLGILALIGVVTGGYFYIKHIGATEQHETDMSDLKKRNDAEKKESDLVLSKALEDNAKLKEAHEKSYIGILTNASQTIKVTQSQRDAATNELLKLKQRVGSKESSSSTKGREASISKGGIGGTGTACSEVSDQELEYRLEVSRLSTLCLLGAGFIREYAEVK